MTIDAYDVLDTGYFKEEPNVLIDKLKSKYPGADTTEVLRLAKGYALASQESRILMKKGQNDLLSGLNTPIVMDLGDQNTTVLAQTGIDFQERISLDEQKADKAKKEFTSSAMANEWSKNYISFGGDNTELASHECENSGRI